MIQESTQHLLQKYREGTLSEAELAELNSLTHKDEVVGRARRRAAGIVLRRSAGRVGLAVAALAVVGAGAWALRPHPDGQPLVASAPAPAAADLSPATPQEASYQGRREEEEGTSKMLADSQLAKGQKRAKTASASQNASPTPAVVASRPQAVEQQRVEAVVTCNNQCEADSVISDIWKFLSA